MHKDSLAHPLGAQTVGRAVQLLKLVASSRARNLRLADIAEMASLDKSTAHRLLQRLVHERLLDHNAMHGYRLGPLVFELGLAAMPGTDLREVSRAALYTLAQRTGDSVFLVRRSSLETVCLNRITGHFPIQTMTRAVGDRHPLGAGAGGLAVLASLGDVDVLTIIETIHPRLRSYGLTDRALREAVDATRKRGGLAIDEGCAARDVTAMGRVIPNGANQPSAAVFVASIHDRMTGNRRNQVDTALRECVRTAARATTSRSGSTANA